MQQSNKQIKQIPCPSCKTLSDFSSENPYRPFCSARCKMVDLGEWANESYKIPEKILPTDVDNLN
jgi:uncharacterized protein